MLKTDCLWVVLWIAGLAAVAGTPAPVVVVPASAAGTDGDFGYGRCLGPGGGGASRITACGFLLVEFQEHLLRTRIILVGCQFKPPTRLFLIGIDAEPEKIHLPESELSVRESASPRQIGIARAPCRSSE